MNINLAVLFSFFLLRKQKCKHEKVTPLSNGNYCPDCGIEIKIKWHIVRCGCCNSKRQGVSGYNRIFPTDKFCAKCGDKSFYVENIEKVQFYELSMAVWSKEEVLNKPYFNSKTQVWVEEHIIGTSLIPFFSS
ncbi:MAG: hypothetical protein WCK67_05315 [bacterium]